MEDTRVQLGDWADTERVEEDEALAKAKRRNGERKGRTKGSGDSTKQKGAIVEEIAAMMHEEPGVRVERDVRLPTVDGAGERQIDVLLTVKAAGYLTARWVIECKNYKREINLGDIDKFVGVLNDVGVPTQCGIYVCAGGYGGGAVRRAREAGITLLSLTGLNKDRLRAQVKRAVQSVIFVVPTVERFVVTNNVEEREDWEQMLLLYDQEGRVRGYVPDLFWRDWLEGHPPSELGEHSLEPDIPDGWHTKVDGREEPVLSASAVVRISAAVVSFSGSSNQHALVQAPEGVPRKFRQRVSFDTAPGQYPVRVFNSEEQLRRFLDERPGAVRMTVGRVRAPRLRIGHIYWPPSERIYEAMSDLAQRYESGEIPKPGPEDLESLEGDDLNALWEPVWPGHPMLQN